MFSHSKVFVKLNHKLESQLIVRNLNE